MARARKVFQFLMTLVLSSPIPLSATKEKGSIDQIGHRHVARRSIMSEGMETWLGKWAASRVERSGRFAQDGELNEYVDRLGNKVASHSDLKIHVRTKIIDSSEFDSF